MAAAVTGSELRLAYIRWARRSVPALVVPFVMTAIVQVVSASRWWAAASPPIASGARFLFIAVAIASVASGRALRARESASAGLNITRLVSLSWRLLAFSLAPSVIGAVLAMMTRSDLDYYLMLAVTLVALVMLFPRYDQWAAWAAPLDEAGR